MSGENNKKILAVLAHPDDETFGMGGTLAFYSARGVEVFLLCATRGEAGEVDEKYLKDHKSVSELREMELRCAATILGIKEVYFLDYRDSGMLGTQDNTHPEALIQHSVDEVAGKIVGYIRQIQPDVVLTFDPIGGYRHPDHIHIHQATTHAFNEAGNMDSYPTAGSPYQPLAMYYHTISHTFIKVAIFLLRIFGKDPQRFGKNGDIDLLSIASVSFPVHVKINIRSVLRKKEMATRCHVSQGGLQMRRGVMGWIRAIFGESETFMRSFPPCHDIKYRTDDIFREIQKP